MTWSLSGVIATGVCSGCGKAIDRDYCWCGDRIDKHVGEHVAVPAGCECHRRIDPEDSEVS